MKREKKSYARIAYMKIMIYLNVQNVMKVFIYQKILFIQQNVKFVRLKIAKNAMIIIYVIDVNLALS